MIPQSKVVVYAAIAGLLALMGGFVLFASFENPELERATIELQSVEVREVNNIDNQAELEVIFLVGNPSDLTFTIPLITYELSVDGVVLGTGQYSTEDIAMPGRAAFYAGVEIPLKSKFVLNLTPDNGEIYRMITSGSGVDYEAKGMITVETSWSLIEKEFSSSLR